MQEADKWGNVNHRYGILVNGQKLYWDASQVACKRMADIGNPKTVIIKRIDKGEKTMFNYHVEGDVNVQEQNVVQVTEAPKDDFQDKVSRGAAWNNAVAYVLKKEDISTMSVADLCGAVCEVAEVISVFQKAFVNGEKKDPVEMARDIMGGEVVGSITDKLVADKKAEDIDDLPFN